MVLSQSHALPADTSPKKKSWYIGGKKFSRNDTNLGYVIPSNKAGLTEELRFHSYSV